MAADESRVSITSWPEGQAAMLRHSFGGNEPCPVSVSFADVPAQVVLSSSAAQPVHVEMAMQVVAKRPIPVCISVCEPICARSDYVVGIQIFGNPFASIDVRGMTRFFQCRDEPPVTVETCLDFNQIAGGQTFTQPVTVAGVSFAPVADPLRSVTFGDPAATVKLGFPPAGVRIGFAGAVRDVRLTVNNYAGETINFTAFAGNTQLVSFSESIINAVKDVLIAQTGITAIVVSGGNNEAGLVRVCYTPVAVANGPG